MVCVINRKSDDPQYNHAVVVIGVQRKEGSDGESAELLHYLDPASERGLEQAETETFEKWWERGRRAMMIVLVPPAERKAASP